MTRSVLQTVADELRAVEENIQEADREIDSLLQELYDAEVLVNNIQTKLRERRHYGVNLIGKKDRLLERVAEIVSNAG